MGTTLLNLSWKNWVKIFVFCQTLIFCMMLGTLGAKSWVYTRNSKTIAYEDSDAYNSILFLSYFDGDLYSCTRSCDKSYKYLSDEWCDFYDEFGDESESIIYVKDYEYSTYEYEAKTLCKTFKALHQAMTFYVPLESVSISNIFSWVILTLLTLRKKSWILILISIVVSILASLLHLAGFIGYMVNTRTNFNLNCKYFPEYTGNQMNLCAGDGPQLALFISIFLPLVILAYFLVFFILMKKKSAKTVSS